MIDNDKVVVAVEVPEAPFQDKPVYYLGSGIPTMIDEMLNHGLTPPEFADVQGDFVVSFFGTLKKNDLAFDSGGGTINDTINSTLNVNAYKILGIINKDSTITVEFARRSRRGIYQILKA